MIDVAAGNKIYYYHFDGLGSVIALSNNSGDIVERYSYDVFGEPNRTSSVGNPYMFTGRAYDSESGLYYYRARYYKPDIGRFLQADPIGYAAGSNLYRYCLNNPTKWVDPSGLCEEAVGDEDYINGKPVDLLDLIEKNSSGPLLYAQIHCYVLNTQGLLGSGQATLDAAGVVDPTGIADAINAVIYAARGQWGNATISAMAIIPYIGDLGKIAKYGDEVVELAAKYGDEAGDWILKSSHIEKGFRRGARKTGVSIQNIYENIRTGERKVMHEVINDSGKVVDSHFRPFYKPRKGEI